MKPFSDKILQVVLLAAGKGTRMYSELPKVLHPICGRSLLHRVSVAALGLAPAKMITVAGYKQELVAREIEKIKSETNFSDIAIAIQEKQLGTADAVKAAIPYLDAKVEYVLIVPGDSPLLTTEVLQNFIEHALKQKSDLSFLTCELNDPASFGRVVRDKAGKVQAIVEKKDCSPEQLEIKEINTSIYFGKRDILLKYLEKIKNNNAQSEYYLTDVVSIGVESKDNISAILTQDYVATLGANNRAELADLEKIRRNQINKIHQLNGVTLEDPEHTYIDEDITIAPDSYLGAGTRLKGKTTIAQGVKIDGNSLIENSQIGAFTHIKFTSHIESSKIGENCHIGPFAHIRPESILHNDVHIGNFVETKKTEMKSGAKANHLTYLGDSLVEEKVNVGAGTITCNYDGVNKNKTVIKKGAFIGSNSSLVAPVTIGENSYVAAGSVINKDVPSSSLAIARAKQEIKEGWANKK